MSKVLNHKSWWRPLWSGLIIHPTAKHLDKMGMSIWLYLYLLLRADTETGSVRKSIPEIVRDMGVPLRTVKRWVSILKKEEYIKVEKIKKSIVIHIHNYKTSKVPKVAPVKCQIWPDTSARTGPEKTCGKPQNLQSLSDIIAQSRFSTVDNVNRLNKLDNNVNVIYKYENEYFYENEFVPQNKEELLALDIAKGLQDTKNLKAYLNLTKQHSESFLRTIYGQVKELPDDKIKKSKGAYFMFLIKRQCHKHNEH